MMKSNLLVYVVWLPGSARTHRLLTSRDVLSFLVPAAVFAATNWLVYEILQRLPASTFQLLSSPKTVATAVLFKLLLKVPILIRQM